MPAYQSKRQAAAEPEMVRAALAAWELNPLTKGLDPRKLRPGEVIRLLNSTDLGPVIVPGKLDRQRARAGFRIGDGKTVDFFRYVAWLFDERHTGPPAGPGPGAGPTGRLSKQAAYSRGKASEAADIGAIRPVVNPERKEACRFNLELFLTTYFPASTGLHPFSSDHKRVIARLQEIILHGGREAKAVYRGFAKTTISENGAIWAVGYGHRRFVAFFGATRTAASDNMDSIKGELEGNELLDEDFPEITQAIRALEGKVQRCASQTCEGIRTYLEWTAGKIVLPSIEGSLAGGGVITCNGITAATRGLKHKRPDGSPQRPDMTIIDDPQTDQSAAKSGSVTKRMGLLRKVILRLAGHQKSIACAVNGTIIETDDLMDQLTNPAKNRDFQKERIKMVRQWPKAHETFWLGEYAKVRRTYSAEDPEDQARAHREANDLYASRRAEADAGGEISWEHCFDHDLEISALQHAYNILIDDGPEVFASECQQEPQGNVEDKDKPSLAGIDEKVNRLSRGLLPIWTTHLVGFGDCHLNALYYGLLAVGDDFTAAIVDYGTEPEQPRDYFTLREAPRTLPQELIAAKKTGGEEAALWHGLAQLEERILARSWKREDGTEMRVDRFLIDSGWQTDTVYEYCRRSPHGAVLMPSKGDAVTSGKRPMTEWEIKPHERPGFHFVVTTDPSRRAVRLFKFDPHFWKTFVARRLKALGPGALSVFGEDPGRHRMLADHFKAESCQYTFGRGRVVWEWKQRPGEDNHLLDVFTGCFAAAAERGCRLVENRRKEAPKPSGPKTRLNLQGPDGKSFFVTDR
jgi:hypothetical protein